MLEAVIITVLIVLAVFGVADAVTGRSRSALPSHYIGGTLPPRGPVITSQAAAQLRRAIALVAVMIELNELQDTAEVGEVSTNNAARAWLAEGLGKSSTDADLLAKAGTLLHQIEIEDKMLKTLEEGRRHRLASWLDDYLNRTRESR